MSEMEPVSRIDKKKQFFIQFAASFILTIALMAFCLLFTAIFDFFGVLFLPTFLLLMTALFYSFIRFFI